MEKAFRIKRLWFVIATMIIVVLCTVCLVACGGDDGTSGDSGTHTVHNYDNYVCTVCGEYALDAPVTEGLSYAEVEEDGVVVGYAVTGIGDVTDTDIMIPQSYNDKPVIRIGQDAFADCSSLASIAIPNSVTSIGYGAFYNTAYYNDDSNWKNEVLYIGKHLIQAKFTISGTYTIKQGTLTIADSAFNGMRSENGEWQYCNNLTSITIPNSVTSIGNEAFRDCNGLTSIVIPNSVKSIGHIAFCDCSSLASVTLGNKVSSIGSTAFAGCSSLTSITMPDSVTSIGNNAFRGCSSLTSMSIPNNTTIIARQVFSWCTSLTCVMISNGVTEIEPCAFEYCVALSNIKFNGTKEQWEAIQKHELWNTNLDLYMGYQYSFIKTVECTDGTITLSDD